MTDDFKEIVKINKFHLDEEWLGQPSLFYTFAEELAEAQRVYDKLKEKLEIVKAELSIAIVKKPSNFGLHKTTQALIESTLLLNDEYKEALEEVREAKYNVSVLQSAVKALEQRKSALENLVKLHGQSYYAEPQVQSEEQAESVKEIKKSSARERVKRRRRRRTESDD